MLSPKIRYFLIILGMLIFALATPVFVLFVKGVKYDFAQKKFLATGILSIKADPDDTEVYLDGKLARATPGTIRFLTPKIYEVSLQKNGYFPWRKKFAVWPNEVVWASAPYQKVFLLANDTNPQNLQTKVKDFVLLPSGYAALTDKELIIFKNDSASAAEKLPAEFNELSASSDFRYFILNNHNPDNSPLYVYDSAEKKMHNLSALFPAGADQPRLKFDSQNTLFALFGNNLFRIDLNPLHKDLLLATVKDFAIFGQDVYNLTSKNQSLSLGNFDQNSKTNQTLLDALPAFNSTSLFVTPQKNLYLVGDGSLYTLSLEGLKKISDEVKEISGNFTDNGVALISSTELWIINPNGLPVFITRSQLPFLNPQARPEIGFAFVLSDNKLMAWEINREGEQNSYTLYGGTAIKKYQIDQSGRRVYILDQEKFISLKLR